MDDWFTLERIDEDTDILSEYRHWEETHCYLLRGRERSLLIDTGLGICDIRQAVDRLTDRPVAAVATHIHWDHIGGHRYFPEFYAHEAELNWLSGGFPLSVEAVRAMVADRCCLPEDFDVSRYTLFQGHPARVLRDGDRIELGGRTLEVLHTPGHSPGHMCFWEAERGYLFSGDLVYRGTLFACYPSTDPEEYLSSLERTACLPMERLLPAHHALDIGFGTRFDDSSFEFCPVVPEELVAVVPAGHPLAQQEQVTLEQLSRERLVIYNQASPTRNLVLSMFRQQDLQPDVAFEVATDHMLASFVSQGLGVGIMPRMFGLRLYSVRPLYIADTETHRMLYMFRPKDRRVLPAVQRFWDFVLEVCAQYQSDE